MNTLGYFGENDSCVEILADAQAQAEGFTHPKMTDFSAKRILENLDEHTLDKVQRYSSSAEFGVIGRTLFISAQADFKIEFLERCFCSFFLIFAFTSDSLSKSTSSNMPEFLYLSKNATEFL